AVLNEAWKLAPFRVAVVHVLPSMEKKGIGGELLSFAEDKAGSPCYLWCRKENTKAMIFYLNRGYIIEEEKVINAAMTEVKLIKFQSPREEKNSSTSIL
ncbi:MAG: GNAT family N-acetyltransferase, partial [Candidatus Ornithospirochaeta sp.]